MPKPHIDPIIERLDLIRADIEHLHVELHNIRAVLAYGTTVPVEDKLEIMPEGKEILD